MAFDFAEKSHQHSAPIELYRFAVTNQSAGTNLNVLGYTNSEYAVSLGGITYQPIPIKRDNIKIIGALDKSQLTVSMSASTDLATMIQFAAPSGIIVLTIYRLHVTDKYNEIRQWWTGRITNYSRKMSEVTLLGESSITSLARPGLRRNYQYQCPLQLYGVDCRATRRADTFTAAARGGASLVTATSTSTPSATDYLNGTIVWVDATGATQTRWITGAAIVSGTATYQFTTSGSTATIAPGTVLTLYRGCDKTRQTCRDRFQNIENFGGQPFIPTKNPNGTVSPFI